MSNWVEQAVQRRNTAAFIAARPTIISLIPSMRQRTAAGGSVFVDGPVRAAQTFRVVEQGSGPNNNPGQLRAADGSQERVIFMLLGAWDVVVAVGDHWTDSSGLKYKVTELAPDNGYEKRAKVERYG